MTQQGDVLLSHTADGGEIAMQNGLVAMSGGLATAAYLSLFGGNADDDGRKDNPHTWWGNRIETVPDRQYRSETQYLLQVLPPIPANLRRLEQAAERDLAWFVTVGVASHVAVAASMPGVNRVALSVTIDNNDKFDFIENWRADTA